MLQAEVTFHRSFTVAPVPRRLFGSFVEHMGRCVYGGIYEPGHPTADDTGFRDDVLELDGKTAPGRRRSSPSGRGKRSRSPRSMRSRRSTTTPRRAPSSSSPLAQRIRHRRDHAAERILAPRRAPPPRRRVDHRRQQCDAAGRLPRSHHQSPTSAGGPADARHPPASWHLLRVPGPIRMTTRDTRDT